MKKLAIILLLILICNTAFADTQDYVRGNVILVRSNIAYFDLGEKDGIAVGQKFEIIYDQRIVTEGVVDWVDRNISRSRQIDTKAAAEIALYEPVTVRIRLYVANANRGGHINVAYFTDLNLDPAMIYTPDDMMVSRLIHRGLLMRNADGDIVPDLCGDYEIRDLTYTFYISPEARFHNGKQVEAADVAYSLEQLALSPKLTNFSCFVLEIAGAEDFRSHAKQEIAGIFFVDKNAIAITLKRPFPAFEEYLAGPGGYIIPKPGYISTGSNAIGTGPYKIKWSGPDGLVLEPFADVGGQAYLDSLRFVRYANLEEAGLAFELGRLDLICLLGEPPPKFVTRGTFTSQNIETCANVILGINNKRDFQKNENFGKALSFLFDRTAVVRVILGGSGGNPMFEPPARPGMGISLSVPFLPDSAQYYLSQAGKLPPSMTLYIDSSYSVLNKVSRYIVGQLQNKGIKVIETRTDFRRLDESRAASDLDMYLTFHIPASGDPDCLFYPLLSRDLFGQTNFLGYSDEALETFLDDMHEQTDPERRDNISFGLAQSLNAEPPLVFLYRPYLTTITKTDISGLVPEKNGYVDLRRVFIEIE